MCIYAEYRCASKFSWRCSRFRIAVCQVLQDRVAGFEYEEKHGGKACNGGGQIQTVLETNEEICQAIVLLFY